METTLILKHILPHEIVEHFDLTGINAEGGKLFFSLDEKPIPPPEHSDKHLVSKGFVPTVQILDFPIREKAVFLQVRRRKWEDKETGKTYTRDWDLKAKGTSYTVEFASFLKELLG